MTEREIVMTGIGGQGIQLAAQVLCRAALAEDRDVQLFGSYGGMMRGGNTEATIVVADGAVQSPPTVGKAWAALVMHHEHFAPVQRLLRPGSVVLLNSSVFEGSFDRNPYTVVDVPATDVAGRVGNMMAASMVMLGAFGRATGVVSLDSLQEAVGEALPPYRARHAALNVAALEAGFGAVAGGVAEAWPAHQEVGA